MRGTAATYDDALRYAAWLRDSEVFQEASLTEAGPELWKDAWFRLTLADAYSGFLIVYFWVAYKERTLGSKIVWFILFMALGNMAVSAYILIQLFRVRHESLAESLLLKAER